MHNDYYVYLLVALQPKRNNKHKNFVNSPCKIPKLCYDSYIESGKLRVMTGYVGVTSPRHVQEDAAFFFGEGVKFMVSAPSIGLHAEYTAML